MPKKAKSARSSNKGVKTRELRHKRLRKGQKSRDSLLKDALDRTIAKNTAQLLLEKPRKPESPAALRQRQLAALVSGADPPRRKVDTGQLLQALAGLNNLSTDDKSENLGIE